MVAYVEHLRIEETVNPRPPAPTPTRIVRARAMAGCALWEAGENTGAAAERLGHLIGRLFKNPLQWAGNRIEGDME